MGNTFIPISKRIAVKKEGPVIIIMEKDNFDRLVDKIKVTEDEWRKMITQGGTLLKWGI